VTWAMLGRAALCIAAAAMAFEPMAAAQSSDESPRESARTLADDGRKAFVAGDYSRAVDLFRKAFALFPAPTLSVYEARALARSGHLVEAGQVYAKTIGIAVAAQSPEQYHRAIREAEAELAELTPRIPRVTLHLEGSGADDPNLTVVLDGVTWNREALDVPAPANPGPHRVLVRTPAGVGTTRDFTLAEGESKRIEVVLNGAPAERAVPEGPSVQRRDERSQASRSPASRKAIGYAAIGVGAAGLGTGIVAGLLASSRHDDAERQCPDHLCTQGTAGESSLDAFRTLRTVSTVGYVAGALGMATGITVLFVLPATAPQGQSASVRGWIGAGRAGIAGAF